MARGFSSFEEALLGFEAQDVNVEWYPRVVAGIQNTIQCYHVIYDRKKELLPRHHWIVFSSESQTWIQQRTGTCAINIRLEQSYSLPSISYCWWSFSSTISHLLPLLQSVSLLICSPDASPYMPAIVLYHQIFNVLILCLLFIYDFRAKHYNLLQ